VKPVESKETHPLELLLGGLALVACVYVGAVWAGAELASFAASGRWLHASVDDAIQAASGLPRNWENPRRAWPSALRDGLPGPVVLYGVSASIVVAGVVLVLVVATRIAGDRPGRGETARWAGASDLRRLLSWSPRRGRVTLGRRGARLVCAERLHSTLVVGPTQTGKTTGLAIPAILEWDGPVLAASVKSDLLRDTFEARHKRGQVQLFDPAGSTGLESSSWTPLAACTTWAGARRTAAWLAAGGAPNKHNLSDGDFWYAAATKLLAPLLFAAATGGRTMADVIRWIDTQEKLEVRLHLKRTKNKAAEDAFKASTQRDERQASSIYTTAETILEAYADPDVLQHSRTAAIRTSQLFNGGQHTLYLSATVREQRRLRPVFVALIEAVLEEAYRRASRRGRPLDPPLLVVLDEAANIAPLQDLDVIAATGAGHGVQLVTVFQDLAQVHDRWGSDRADTIVNNHRARLFAGGTADGRTLDYLARMLGDTEVRQESSTSAELGRRSSTLSSTYRPLAPQHSIREGRSGSCLLLYGNLRPAWIRFRPWYRVHSLRRQRRMARSAGLSAERSG
jgi:type IV secretion system protein VirD4